MSDTNKEILNDLGLVTPLPLTLQGYTHMSVVSRQTHPSDSLLRQTCLSYCLIETDMPVLLITSLTVSDTNKEILNDLGLVFFSALYYSRA